MKKSFLFLLLIFFSASSFSQKISIQGNEFYTDCGKRIFLNGANTPWDNWNDFGGSFDVNIR